MTLGRDFFARSVHAVAPELVGATLLLLSPTAGSFITGEAIYVDGGFTAMMI